MRVIIFFDLPTKTSRDRREYQRFRKELIKSGFIMMQESVYTKLTLSPTAADLVVKQVKRFSPRKGIIQSLIITEKQFSRIEYITGENKSEVVNTEERTLII